MSILPPAATFVLIYRVQAGPNKESLLKESARTLCVAKFVVDFFFNILPIKNGITTSNKYQVPISTAQTFSHSTHLNFIA